MKPNPNKICAACALKNPSPLESALTPVGREMLTFQRHELDGNESRRRLLSELGSNLWRARSEEKKQHGGTLFAPRSLTMFCELQLQQKKTNIKNVSPNSSHCHSLAKDIL